MNKARLHLNEYIEHLGNIDLQAFDKTYKERFYGHWNEPEVREISDNYDKLIKHDFYSQKRNYYFNKNMFDKVKMVNDYINHNDFYWNVTAQIDNYCVISYGKHSLFVLSAFLEIFEVETYSDYTPDELRQKLLGDIKQSDSYLPANFSQVSVKTIEGQKQSVNDQMNSLKDQMEDIKNNKNEELAKIQKEIDEKMALLNNKKEVLMKELYEKMSEFEEKLKVLKNQIFMLKSEIYSIRCFAGETIELLQIRNGKNEEIDVPVVLNQKILYLDEDLAKTMSIYNNDIEHNYKLLEEALKYNDYVMEVFCPQPKSISFFRCSKSGNSYEYNSEDDILQSYDMLHGNKMGFIVRNGENLYIGWFEEEWDRDTSDKDAHILTFEDSVIYKPEKKEMQLDERTNNMSTPIDHMVSRMFAISVLQGLIEHKEILSLPKDTKIGIPSKYVIHNYADAWIEDNRYGDFATLVENLHHYNRVNDTILLITPASESNYKAYQANRSRGDRNTTRDCSVTSGLNRINLIEDNRIFVSAKKEDWGWIERKNNANFEIDKDEFINLTFMNSDWLRYYIDTKKIGNFGWYKNVHGHGDSLEYAYMIKYFKTAYEYIINREKDEELLINKYIINLNSYDWRNLLSHWKIKNNVRVITDYQAKRFAKYLESGKYYIIKHLFIDTFKYPKSPHLAHEFFATAISGNSRDARYCTSKHNSIYGWKDDDLVDKVFTEKTSIEEIIERVKFDEEKLKLIRKRVIEYANEQGIDIVNDSYFKKQLKNIFNEKQLNEMVYSTIRVVINNICVNECPYEELKEHFKKDVKSSIYYWWNAMDEKLMHLNYIRILQDKIYPYIIDCIRETIKYNYIYEIEDI